MTLIRRATMIKTFDKQSQSCQLLSRWNFGTGIERKKEIDFEDFGNYCKIDLLSAIDIENQAILW